MKVNSAGYGARALLSSWPGSAGPSASTEWRRLMARSSRAMTTRQPFIAAGGVILAPIPIWVRPCHIGDEDRRLHRSLTGCEEDAARRASVEADDFADSRD